MDYREKAHLLVGSIDGCGVGLGVLKICMDVVGLPFFFEFFFGGVGLKGNQKDNHHFRAPVTNLFEVPKVRNTNVSSLF